MEVQNFSLPNRSNSRRPFSPVPTAVTSEHRSCSRMDNDDTATDTAAVASALHADGTGGDVDVDCVPVRSPTPTALQLFHFSEDAARAMDRRSSRVLPRPMSTSSSAPALGSVIQATSCGADVRPGPCSPPSAWPRPRSEYAGAARTYTHSFSMSARDVSQDTATTAASPPPIERSISIRFGPRLRHIPMSEVQAADDAARRVAAARRERIVFWTLVATALIGVLSCTAAVTLAAAQAALQAGLEDVGEGGGIIWDARTLGWLIASLILCASAAVGLVVATSTRCRRSRRMNRWRSRTPTPSPTPTPPTTSPSPTGRPKDQSENKGNDKTTMAAPGANRPSDLHSRRQEDSAAKGAWVEMQEVGIRRDSVVEHPAKKWWNFGGKLPMPMPVHIKGSGPGHRQGTLNDGPNDTAFQPAVSSSDGTMDVPDEDRNWAKFSRDTVQLRRYVESLEARLAGSQEAPAAKPDKTSSAAIEHINTVHSVSPKRIRIRPSTSVRTITSADTATTAATSTTLQPIMGGAGPSAPHSAYSLLLPPGSPSSVVSASMVSSSSPRRPRNSTTNGQTVVRDVGRDLTSSQAPPLPASDTQTSILGQLYSSYSERGRA